MILTTDAQLRIFGVNEHPKIIYVFIFVGIVTRRIETEHRKSRLVLMIFERTYLDFLFYIYFDEFYICMTWFYLLNWITLKMFERLRQGGRLKRKGASSSQVV